MLDDDGGSGDEGQNFIRSLENSTSVADAKKFAEDNYDDANQGAVKQAAQAALSQVAGGGEQPPGRKTVTKTPTGYVVSSDFTITATRTHKNANQGGPGSGDPTAVDPSTLGHNLFYSNYIGPWNPKDVSGNWSYRPATKGILDYYAEQHDKAYDKAHVTGFSGVLTSFDTIGADYTLVGNSFNLLIDPYTPATPVERLEGLPVGLFIGIFALPKTIIYGLGVAGEALKN